MICTVNAVKFLQILEQFTDCSQTIECSRLTATIQERRVAHTRDLHEFSFYVTHRDRSRWTDELNRRSSR